MLSLVAESGRDAETAISPREARINDTWATVLYFWPVQRIDHPSATWQRTAARVLPDGELRWGYPVRYSLKANQGIGTLEVSKGAGSDRATWSLKKVEGPSGHNWESAGGA